jgi:hypothetical protein
MEPEHREAVEEYQGGSMEWNRLGQTDHGVAEGKSRVLPPKTPPNNPAEAPEHSPSSPKEHYHHLEDDDYTPLLEPVLASERRKHKRFKNAEQRRKHTYGTADPAEQRQNRHILKKAEQLVKEGRVRKAGPKPSDLPRGNWILGQDGELKEKKSAPNARQRKAFRDARTIEKAEDILRARRIREGLRRMDGVDYLDTWRPGRDGRFGGKSVFPACNADGSELPARKIEWSQDE